MKPALAAKSAPNAPTVNAPGVMEEDELDELSNSVLDLIEAGRFDDALVACQRLVDDYPEVHDGFDRYAMVHAAMGNHALAAGFFRKANAFAADPARRADYDEELIEDWRLRAEEQEELAASAAEREHARAADSERAP